MPTRTFSNRIHKNFSFPRHGELFTQEHLGDDERDYYSTDEEDLGILRKYRAPRNIKAEDVILDDFKKVRKNLQQQMEETYRVDTSNNYQAMENTKNIVARLRHNRSLSKSLGKDFKNNRLQNEYFNHKKYQENFVVRDDMYNPDEPARERLHVKNYRDAMKRLSIKNSEEIREQEREVIRIATMKSKNSDHERFTENYMDEMSELNTDSFNDLRTEEMVGKTDEDFDTYTSDTLQPRMSPWAKTRVHSDYLKGMNIRDISLKYGILPKRAAAIIYQREYWLKVIYPKTGETLARMTMDMERDYGEEFGFVDYGVDLELLQAHEHGTAAYSIGRSAIDKAPPKKVREKIERVLGNMRNKRVHEVPIKHVGNGPKGYLLMELVWNRGKNSIQPRKEVVLGVKRANSERLLGYRV